MRKPTWLLTVALAGTLAMVSAACANNDNGGGAGGGGGSTTSGGASTVDCDTAPGCVTVGSGEPIKIGTLLAIAGPNKNLGLDSQYGVELAVDYLDGSFDGTDGQIAGHDVTLVNEDDHCSAEGGQKGATTLAADPQIVGVIGTSCSSASLGVADKIFSDKGIVIISPSATNPALTAEGTHQPYYFRTAHNDRIQAAVASDFALQKLSARRSRSTTRARTRRGSRTGSRPTSRPAAGRCCPRRPSTAATRTSRRCSPGSPRTRPTSCTRRTSTRCARTWRSR
jgi:branched-chain amino acid transport system substrate-binding protein